MVHLIPKLIFGNGALQIFIQVAQYWLGGQWLSETKKGHYWEENAVHKALSKIGKKHFLHYRHKNVRNWWPEPHSALSSFVRDEKALLELLNSQYANNWTFS